jgi:addiction module HigA family antidote
MTIAVADAPHVGTFVARLLEEYGLTQGELADAIHVSRLTINELVGGRRGLTPSIALRLARLTSTSPKLWMDFHRDWSLARTLDMEDREIASIKPLPKRA